MTAAGDQLLKEQRKAEREKYELEFKVQLLADQVHGWEREYKFHSTRQWRFDFAFPQPKIAIEIEGGIWKKGRHSSSAGVMGDIEKYNAATLAGWAVFRVTPETITDGHALLHVKQLIVLRGGVEGRDVRLGTCKKCKGEIAWLKTKNNKNMPTELDGLLESDRQFDPDRHTSHFEICPALKDGKS